MTLNLDTLTPSSWTYAVQPRSGTALDPTVTEVSWTGWKLTAADPEVVTEQLPLLLQARLSYLVESNWFPGRSVIFSEVEIEPMSNGSLQTHIRLGMGHFGATGTTQEEIEAAAKAAFWFKDDRFFSTEAINLTNVLNREDTSSWDSFIVRQGIASLEIGDQTVDVVRRFNSLVTSWTRLADILISYGRAVRIRGTLLATELSAFDKADLTSRISALQRLDQSSPADKQHAITRARTTLVDLQESYASPLFIGEYAVSSPERLPDTLARAIGIAITCETDVTHLNGRTVVAAQQLMIGGFEIDRDTEQLNEALNQGLPLRGGLIGRELRDLMTLTESPIGLPIAYQTPFPGIPATIAESDTALELAPINAADALGTSEMGLPIAIPDHLRTQHVFTVGTWGTGKSTIMSHRINSALRRNRQFLLLDPHGDLAERTREAASQFGRRVRYLSPFDPDSDQISLIDRLTQSGANRSLIERQAAILSDAIATSIDDESWHGPRGKAIISALLDVLAATSMNWYDLVSWFNEGKDREGYLELPTVSRLARSTLLPLVGSLSTRDAGEVRTWASSKLNALVVGSVRNILERPGCGPTISDVVDEGSSLVVNLRGLSNSEVRLVGHIILDSVTEHIMGQTVIGAQDFDLFVDEAHAFPTHGLRRALTEGRKFGIGLVLASQSIGQLDAALGDLLLAAGTAIVFRPTPDTLTRTAKHLGLQSNTLRKLNTLEALVAIRGHDPLKVHVHPYRSLFSLTDSEVG